MAARSHGSLFASSGSGYVARVGVNATYARLRDRADAAVQNGSPDAPQVTADAVRWCRNHLKPGDPELAWALVRQAYAAAATGYVVKVEGKTSYQFVLRVLRRTRPPRNSGRASYPFVPLFEEALAVLRATSGPYSEPVAAVLSSFAECLSSQDQLAALEPLREQLTVLWHLRGPSHPDTGVAAFVLAQALSQSAQTLREEAVTRYEVSVSVWAQQPASPWAALTWSGRGFLAETTGDLDTAEYAYRQAVQAARALATGPSPDLATHQLAVGRIAARKGQPDAAVPWFEEALAAQRAVLGDASLAVAATWRSISLATDGVRSLEASREALRAAGAWLETGAAAELTDQQRDATLPDLIRYADWHLWQLLPTGTAVGEAAEVIAWRRRLPSLLWRPWQLSPDISPDERELSAVLSELATRDQERYQIADTNHRVGAEGEAWIGHALRTRQLLDKRAELEGRLRREAAIGQAARPLVSGVFDTARRALSLDERFVGIAGAGGRYVAIVVGPGDGQAALIDLGQAALIDQAAWRTRAALEGPGRAAAFRDIGLLPEPETAADAPGVLARMVIEPLLPHLTGARRLRVALDGPLLHVPLGTLPVGPVPLLTLFAIDYVTGIDGLAAVGRVAAESRPDLVLAAPDFDLGRAGPGNRDSLFRPLVGTAQEAAAIARHLPDAIVLTGREALKTRLRDIRSPRVLHLATHGYTLARASPGELKRTDQRLRQTDSELAGRYGNLASSPDLRSGLALAGANTWLEHGDPGPLAETGLLTVADVIGLELSGTEMVVLSACDTGVGEITAVDGHLSLRAAFLRAGAKTVVASLWKVPDRPTCDLMTEFYELLARGHGPASALRTVQLAHHAVGDPVLNWGAFVCYSGAGAMPAGRPGPG